MVEDNMTVATKFIEQIKKTGSNKIDHVTTGEDALELIESNKYDLIFMDYTLGDVMNGDQLTLIIRKADINTPIVSISNMDLGDAGPMILHRNGYNGQILKDNYIGLPDNVEKIVNFWIDKGLIREFN
ncbi:MAG: response regulator [Proteobacteria bacterium]|nr:response regulator [Pseudomonadota bacterium]